MQFHLFSLKLSKKNKNPNKKRTMPPKSALGQKLKEAREVFTEDVLNNVVEGWSVLCALNLVQAEAGAKEIAANVAARAASAEEAPADILDLLKVFHFTFSNVASEIQVVRSGILLRFPEIKEEDNLGVNVQLCVLKELDDLEKKVLGGGAEGASLPTLNFRREYFAARTTIEEKILGSGKEDEKPSKSPSLKLQLQQLDYDTAVKAAIGFAALAARLRSAVAAYSLNSKKLMNPRNNNDRMTN